MNREIKKWVRCHTEGGKLYLFDKWYELHEIDGKPATVETDDNRRTVALEYFDMENIVESKGRPAPGVYKDDLLQAMENDGIITPAPQVEQINTTEKRVENIPENRREVERFKKPSGEDLVKIAVLFTDGELDELVLTKMVSMAMFVVDRLYENGDVSIPTIDETELENPMGV